VLAGAADRDDAAILCAAPTGAAALRFSGFIEQVVHSGRPLVAKIYPESSLDFLLVAAPRSADAAARIAGTSGCGTRQLFQVLDRT
jgi:hypothetical protein